MRFPIDIIWLDSGWKVVDTKVKARPWLYYGVPKTPARMVLEVNWGTIARTGTEVKDILKFDGVKFVKGGQIPSWDNR